MYSTDVNDLLTVNLTGIQALYNKLASVKTLKARKMLVSAVPSALSKVLTIDQVLHGLNGVTSNLSEDKLVRAFYLSKMTVTEETLSHGQLELSLLRWPEFVEFVCRAAYLRHEKTEVSSKVRLDDMLRPLLDAWLPLAGYSRIEPPPMTNVISESDDDY